MPNFFLSYKRVKVAARLTKMQVKIFGAPDLKQARPDMAQGPPKSPMTLNSWGSLGLKWS
jgi:hypothetical protein